MNWIEVITLRSREYVRDALISELLGPATQCPENGCLMSMTIYRNAWIDTDVSVHLRWKSISPEQQGSDIGQRLAQSLKEFGLVNHSAWVEEKRRRPGDGASLIGRRNL